MRATDGWIEWLEPSSGTRLRLTFDEVPPHGFKLDEMKTDDFGNDWFDRMRNQDRASRHMLLRLVALEDQR